MPGQAATIAYEDADLRGIHEPGICPKVPKDIPWGFGLQVVAADERDKGFGADGAVNVMEQQATLRQPQIEYIAGSVHPVHEGLEQPRYAKHIDGSRIYNEVCIRHFLKDSPHIILIVMYAVKAGLLCVASAACKAAMYGQRGEGDDLTHGPGRRCPLKKPVD